MKETNINQYFSRILVYLEEAISQFLEKINLLASYKIATGCTPYNPTPGQKMIFKGKLLRIKEIPAELDHLKNNIEKASQKLEELFPTLPKEIKYKENKNIIREPEFIYIFVKNYMLIEKSLEELKKFKNRNPYSTEKTEIMQNCLQVLLMEFKFYVNSVLSESNLQKIKENLSQEHEILSEYEIDALLIEMDKTDIDLTITPDETEEEKYNRLHGIKEKPDYALVLVDVETWLEEKQSQSFWGWTYAMNFLSKIKNKKHAHVREYPYGRWPWISRNREFLYEFDGETIKEEKDLPKSIKGNEDEVYLGEVPANIPINAFFHQNEETKALSKFLTQEFI